MSVKIDPSEVRERSSTSVSRLPWRKVAAFGVGGLGLVVFAVGSFSFFEGLADPRARTPRPKAMAVNLPDLKDGVPTLAPSAESASREAAPAPVMNLPRPSVPEPQRAESETNLELRTSQRASAEFAAPSAADSTGSVTTRPSVPRRPMPSIENAQTLAPDAKPVPLIAPARTETVKAKPSEARDLAALQAEPGVEAAKAAQLQPVHAKVEPKRVEAKPAPAKPAPTRTAKATAPRAVADASAEPAPAAAPVVAAPEPESLSTGLKNGWNAGMKAIGGLIGAE